MKAIAWRALKIAGRIFGLAVVGYVVLLIVSFATMYSQPHAVRSIGDVVEAIVFFPQRYLPPPGEISNLAHWTVCASWVFALIFIPSLAYATMTAGKAPGR